jgi:hypothetical protein
MAAKTVPPEKLSNPLQTPAVKSIYALHYGTRLTPFALVKPDEEWSDRGMYRIHWPNGSVSDIVNLSRAKDAARLIAQRRHPECNKPTLFKWKVGENAEEASPMRRSAMTAAPPPMTPPKSSVLAASNSDSGEN